MSCVRNIAPATRKRRPTAPYLLRVFCCLPSYGPLWVIFKAEGVRRRLPPSCRVSTWACVAAYAICSVVSPQPRILRLFAALHRRHDQRLLIPFCVTACTLYVWSTAFALHGQLSKTCCSESLDERRALATSLKAPLTTCRCCHPGDAISLPSSNAHSFATSTPACCTWDRKCWTPLR